MPKDVKKKPIYETPVVVDLGKLSRSLGADCVDGSGAQIPGGNCNSGNNAGDSCATGNTPVHNCNAGSSPAGG